MENITDIGMVLLKFFIKSGWIQGIVFKIVYILIKINMIQPR